MSVKEPEFPLSKRGIILSLVFLPIGIVVLYFATIIYMADWMCYNYGYPKPLCYILAFFLWPIFLIFFIFSFVFAEHKKSKEERKKSPKRSPKKSPKRSPKKE